MGRADSITPFLQQAVREGVFPGAVRLMFQGCKIALMKCEASWEKVRNEGWGVKSEKIRYSSLFTYGHLAFGCGGAGVPNRLFGEGCLSGASS